MAKLTIECALGICARAIGIDDWSNEDGRYQVVWISDTGQRGLASAEVTVHPILERDTCVSLGAGITIQPYLSNNEVGEDETFEEYISYVHRAEMYYRRVLELVGRKGWKWTGQEVLGNV